jgi:phosphoglycolate phosphatase
VRGVPLEAPPELVVFDWDGTLVDSIDTIVACTRAALDELGLPRVERREILRLIGTGIADSVRELAPGADEATRERIVASYRRLWFSEYHHRPVLIAGAAAAVGELGERGLLLAVATAKSRRGLAADLERTGLADRFHASRTSDEVTPKPSPAMLLAILDELGVRGGRALMVGDSLHDVEMAHNAGVPVVAVASGAQREAALRAAGPLDCLGSVAELVAWLNRVTPSR